MKPKSGQSKLAVLPTERITPLPNRAGGSFKLVTRRSYLPTSEVLR